MQLDMHDVLVKTRDVVLSRGHTKYVSISTDGSVCVFGGVSVGLCGSSRHPFVMMLDCPNGYANWSDWMDEFGRVLGFEDRFEVTMWNDRTDVTKEDVVARLNSAIARTTPMLAAEPEAVAA